LRFDDALFAWILLTGSGGLRETGHDQNDRISSL
jgi:hypothetical protein